MIYQLTAFEIFIADVHSMEAQLVHMFIYEHS